MAEIRRRLTPQRIRLLFGAFLALVLIIELQTSSSPSASLIPAPPEVIASVAKPADGRAQSFADLIRTDPLAALEQAWTEHTRSVRDYTCTFVKQEMLPSGMSHEQTIATKFRAEPYSVLMHWVKNPGKAERVLYVKGRWENPDQS